MGGVVLFRLTPASLASADHATADTMDTRFNNERYTILIRAAREFLAQGNSPRDLSPFAAERLGLIDATVAGYPLLRQTSGFPMLHAVTEAYGFHRVADYLISHQMIRERLAIELGPVKPKDATKSGIWLGPWNDDSIAVGRGCGPERGRQPHRSLRCKSGIDLLSVPAPLFGAAVDPG